MRIDRTNTPKSSFLSVEKDMAIISKELLKNERIKKLLYYTTADALEKPYLTQEESSNLFGKNIKLIPKLTVDSELLNYVFIRFRNFLPNSTNPEFRNNIIEFDIVCPFEMWGLKDFQLRPYRIAAEIDSDFNKKQLTGIGRLEYNGADQMVLNDRFAGICLTYRTIHGDEDKLGMPTPEDEELFLKDFLESNKDNIQ